jgi:hypothetical protein
MEKYWNAATSTWQNSFKETFCYNSEGKKHLRIYYYWDSSISDWKPNRRANYLYFSKGSKSVTESIIQVVENDIWTNFLKQYDTTDAAGKLSGSLEFAWQDDFWKENVRVLYAYDFMGNVSKKNIQMEYSELHGWKNIERILYEYAYYYDDPVKPGNNTATKRNYPRDRGSQNHFDVPYLKDHNGKITCEAFDLSGHMVFSKEMEIGVQNRIYFPNDETITGTPVLIQIKDSNGTIIYKDRMMK